MTAPTVPGAAPDSESGGVIGYQPETPFLLDGAALMPAPPAPAFGRENTSAYQTESPFIAEYDIGGVGEDVQAEAFADLVAELEDEEFEEAVTDLVNEAAALAEERFSFEAGDPVSERIEAERGLRDYLEPVAQECEAMVDRMIQGLGNTDLAPLSEDELEDYLDRFAPAATTLPPTQDRFVEAFFGKLKKGVMGAVKKLSPTHILLGKLKGVVRPLLERVLKFAINKLPVSVRPIATQLAKKFLSAAVKSETMEMEDEDQGEMAAEDPAVIAGELDARIAGYTLEGEDFDRWTSAEEFAAEQDEAGADAWRELQQERARFARDITQIEQGEDPAPAVERFVPAILAALRIGIKIIGRPKVVNFLANLLVKLIGKYVGKQQAVPLSRALVDTGLKLVNLEAENDPELESGFALASTLEDTVTRIAQEAPAEAWESEALLEAYVREAFQSAASAHFPDGMIRPELHEAAQTSGAWVPMPPGGKRKHYKKYSRVLDVTLTPQMAAAIKSFGGTPLQNILRDQLSLPVGRPVNARVHLYEALAGSTLPDIAMHEKSVRGLGSSRREAWSLIHPLTPEAAGMLLKEPGLGRQVDPKFLEDPNRITVGQRMYYLETGSRPRMVAGPRGARRTARVGGTSLTLDFPKGEVRVALYFSEAVAQTLSTQLRSKAPTGTVLTALKSGLGAGIVGLLSGQPGRRLRIVHEAVPTEQFRSPVASAALKLVARPLGRVLNKWMMEALKRELEQRLEQFAAQFTRAAAADADGVTVLIVFRQPSFLAPLRRIFGGGAPMAAAAVGASLMRQAVGDYTLSVRPGFAGSSRQTRRRWQPVSKT